jgi:hypothetical protein
MSDNNDEPSTPPPTTIEIPLKSTPVKPRGHMENGLDVRSVTSIKQPAYLTIMENELGHARIATDDLYNELELHLYKVMKHHRRSLDALIATMVKVMDIARKEYDTVWTEPSSKEADFYVPFMHMVSSGLMVAKERLLNENNFPNLPKERGLDLSFFEYDRAVVNRYGTIDLKPDGVGIIGVDTLGDKQYVAWRDVYCVYEAKRTAGQLNEAIKQASTYARLMFSHQANRTFAHGLLHMCPNLVYFARYDRGGCTFQKTPMDIFTEDGLERFSHILIAMMVFPPLYSGIDQTTSPDGLCFTLDDYVCHVQSTLTYREVLRGHATRAYLVRASKRQQTQGIARVATCETFELADPAPESDRKEAGACEGRADKRHERCSSFLDPDLKDVMVEVKENLPVIPEGEPTDEGDEENTPPNESNEANVLQGPLEKKNDSQMTSGHVQPIPSHSEEKFGIAALDGKAHPSYGYPARTGEKRSIDSSQMESEGTKAKRAKESVDAKEKRDTVRPKREKEWNALFVPVKNFDERRLDKEFVVKESYVLNYGQGNEDREGRAIRDIDKARELLEQVLGDSNTPLLTSLCDYGSRAAVKGFGYVDGSSESQEGTESEDSNAPGDIVQHELVRPSGSEMEDEKKGEDDTMLVEAAEQGNETIGLVDISTKLLNPSTHEVRTLVRQVIYSVGRPLVNAKGPQELLSAIQGILYGTQRSN